MGSSVRSMGVRAQPRRGDVECEGSYSITISMELGLFRLTRRNVGQRE